MSPSADRLRKLGLLVAVGAAAAVGALFVFDADEAAPSEPPPSVGLAADLAAPGQPAAAAQGANEPGDAVPTQGQIDAVAHLLGDARRLAENGQIDQARAAVDEAAKIIPASAEVAQARLDIARKNSPQYRLAQQLSRARLAIAQDDRAAAGAALDAATAIDPTAPQIAELRLRMQQAEQKEAERRRRIDQLLSEMRQAIARHDLVAADRALNEAERLDIRDPAIDPARVELAGAQEDAQRSRQQ